MKRSIALLIVVVLLNLVLAGCGKNGNEFNGKWVNSKNASETVEIKRNGDNFILAHTIPNFFGKQGEMKTSEFPAVLKDGVLTVNAGLGPAAISHVKDDDTLLIGGNKFNRQK